MTIGPMPICLFCKRYREGLNWGDTNTRDAFPESIPEEIEVGGVDHRTTFKGDGGIRLEQRDDLPPYLHLESCSEKPKQSAE
ncbi:MAG: hypothetical protein Q8M16_15345 [Pirellulaceae bacterium]|nr:hypothetical protein [Pirellulaceae bacterium]